MYTLKNPRGDHQRYVSDEHEWNPGHCHGDETGHEEDAFGTTLGNDCTEKVSEYRSGVERAHYNQRAEAELPEIIKAASG